MIKLEDLQPNTSVRVLESGGESEAALSEKLGARAEGAREFASRLYTISERKEWEWEALRDKPLAQGWPEISRLARESGTRRAAQTMLFGGGET